MQRNQQQDSVGLAAGPGWFCPRCTQALPQGSTILVCPACDADFGPTAAWGPVQNAKGQWHPRKTGGDDRPSIGYAVFLLFARLVLGGLVAMTLVMLLMISGSYSGSGGFARTFDVILLLTAIWASLPLLNALYCLIFTRPDRP